MIEVNALIKPIISPGRSSGSGEILFGGLYPYSVGWEGTGFRGKLEYFLI